MGLTQLPGRGLGPRGSWWSPWQPAGTALGPPAAHTSALPAPGPRRDRPWATTGASVPAWLVLPPEAARSRLPPPPRPDLTGKQFPRAAAAVTHRPARIPAIGPSWWRPARADGAAGEAAETQVGSRRTPSAPRRRRREYFFPLFCPMWAPVLWQGGRPPRRPPFAPPTPPPSLQTPFPQSKPFFLKKKKKPCFHPSGPCSPLWPCERGDSGATSGARDPRGPAPPACPGAVRISGSVCPALLLGLLGHA